MLRRAKLDVEPNEVPLPRNQEDGAGILRLDCALETDVGEVGDGKHVDDAPVDVRRVSIQGDAEFPLCESGQHSRFRRSSSRKVSLLPDPAACAIAAHHILGFHRLLLADNAGLRARVGSIVRHEVAPEEPIRNCSNLSGSCFLVGEVAKGDCDGVREGVVRRDGEGEGEDGAVDGEAIFQ